MKKIAMAFALCLVGAALAQEPAAPEAPEQPAAPAACECRAGKRCVCGPECRCAENPACECQGGKRCVCGRACRCAKGAGKGPGKGPGGEPGAHRRGGPRFKKCDCCPECKGVIILPPGSEEGEPLAKLLGRGGRRPVGAAHGHRPGPRGEGGKGGGKGGDAPADVPPPPPPAADAQ